MAKFTHQHQNQIADIGSKKTAESGIRELSSAETKHDRDRVDLARWGKEERLKRIFGTLSTVSLTCCVTMTWLWVLTNFVGSLRNGGHAGFVYSFIFAWIGSMLQALVLAELASMIPVAGGQYHWVAILAPARYSRILSYLTGWMILLAWQAGVATTAFLAGTMIQGLVVLNHDSYTKQLWQTYLILVAVIILAVLINTWLIRGLPHVESFIFIFQIISFFAIVITILYFAPEKASATDVFTKFSNGGGWPSMTLSWFVGLGPTVAVLTGVDAASHIAEEIRDASSTIPRSMIRATLINGLSGFAMILAVLFCIPLHDLDAVLASPTGYPYIQVFYNSTQSLRGTTAMVSITIVLAICFEIGCLATSSRMLWALARENCLPFSKVIAQLQGPNSAPLNAVLISAGLACLIGVIAIGSEVAFYALTSLIITGTNGAYCISAYVLLYRRLRGDELKYGPFTLSHFGVPVIILSIIYSVISTFFSLWPPTVRPSLQLMNWSSVVTAGFMGVSVLFWCLHGRRVYQGSIVEVVLRDGGSEEGVGCDAADAASRELKV